MSRRYIVTALGPDGKVQVQATHDDHVDAVSALAELYEGALGVAISSPGTSRQLLTAWLTGGDTLEILSPDFQNTYSITIIDE